MEGFNVKNRMKIGKILRKGEFFKGFGWDGNKLKMVVFIIKYLGFK